MKEDILKNVLQLKSDMINSIVESVKIPSIIGEAKGNCPFGENIDKALDHALNLCEKLGFKTYKDKEGYYGYAEIGDGDELVGVLGHLDVVPSGDKTSWNTEPFAAVIKDGKIYGRGVSDDKGPTIAAIYALKAVLDSGVKLNKRVRFIFGTDEETLWRDIDKYNKNKEEMPSLGFTPDSSFPCINAEKGLLQCILTSNKASAIKLKAGDAFNAVPSSALYNDIKMDEVEKELSKLDFEFTKTENGINVIGKSVHSAKCYAGINAIVRLCTVLKNIGVETSAINFIVDFIKDAHKGEKIMPNCEDVSGTLTINLGKVDFNEDYEKVYLDIRIPVTVKKEELLNALKDKYQSYGFQYEQYAWEAPLYVKADHFLIKTLTRIYKEETLLDSTPLSSGGATYARAMDNCVAFGPAFPWTEKTAHMPNEYVGIDDLVKATNIYALALFELTR